TSAGYKEEFCATHLVLSHSLPGNTESKTTYLKSDDPFKLPFNDPRKWIYLKQQVYFILEQLSIIFSIETGHQFFGSALGSCSKTFKEMHAILFFSKPQRLALLVRSMWAVYDSSFWTARPLQAGGSPQKEPPKICKDPCHYEANFKKNVGVKNTTCSYGHRAGLNQIQDSFGMENRDDLLKTKELKAYQADVATVLRNGLLSIVPACDLVPGDIVEVGVGCKVPADMRVIEMLGSQLRIDQAILTGESCSVAKEVGMLILFGGINPNTKRKQDVLQQFWTSTSYNADSRGNPCEFSVEDFNRDDLESYVESSPLILGWAPTTWLKELGMREIITKPDVNIIAIFEDEITTKPDTNTSANQDILSFEGRKIFQYYHENTIVKENTSNQGHKIQNECCLDEREIISVEFQRACSNINHHHITNLTLVEHAHITSLVICLVKSEVLVEEHAAQIKCVLGSQCCLDEREIISAEFQRACSDINHDCITNLTLAEHELEVSDGGVVGMPRKESFQD
ncbi:hypothetical protein KI387_028958, partial [Taxus chinensis]